MMLLTCNFLQLANRNEKESDLKLNVNINVNGVKKGNVVPGNLYIWDKIKMFHIYNKLFLHLIFDINRSHFSLASELVLPSLCKALNDTCGYQATHPPKQHGDCCVGMKCQRTGLGGAGQCVIGIFLVIYLCHSNTDILTH